METKLDITNKNTTKTGVTNIAEGFNLGLLVYILNKSVLWMILIVSITVFASFIYLRYTPRIYEASAKLMLQLQKSTQILGLENLIFEKDPSEINHEMLVLKSSIMLNKVAERLPLDISYYKEGKSKFITEDLYLSAPFRVELLSIEPRFYGNPVYIKIINKSTILLSFSFEGTEFEKEFPANHEVTTPYFKAVVNILYEKLGPNDFKSLFFIKFNERSTVISFLNNKITLQPISNTNRELVITCSDQNPEKAKDIANTLADEFIKYDLKKKREGMDNIIVFIDSQIDSFGKVQEAILDSLSKFKLNNEIYSEVNSYDNILTKANKLQEEIVAGELKLASMKNFKTLIQKTKDYTTLPILKFEDSELSIESEINSINELQKQREALLLERTPDHPEVRLLDKQIVASKNQLLKRTDNVIDNATLYLQNQREQYDQLMNKIYNLPELQEKLKRLNRIADARSKFFYNLFDQRSNYAIASAGIVSDYSILSLASTPKTPVSPKETQVKIGGFILGLLLSALLVAIRFLLHQEIISIQEVESGSLVPLLGVIPSYNTPIERSQIVVTKNPKSTITEAYRAVRSNLQFINNSAGSKIITCTSTIPGEGKTFTALNLGAIFSMLDKRVIILDADMRKPRLGKIFNLSKPIGMSTVLSRQSSFDESIQSTGINNIDVVTAGPVPPNPSELLLNNVIDDFLTFLKNHYDIIVIDTPPIGLVTDAITLLKKADYPVYVLRASYSNKSFLNSINKLQAESEIPNLGIILNDFGRGASGYSYNYGYSYGYGYGYGYAYGYGLYGSSYGYKTGYYTDDPTTKPQRTNVLKKIWNAIKP